MSRENDADKAAALAQAQREANERAQEAARRAQEAQKGSGR
jgi:hypothetical protein